MTKEPFDQPRLAINRVYTRQGDGGDTALAGGQRVPKDDTRIAAYGTVDELNSFLGAARSTVNQLAVEEPRLALLAAILLRVQHELFNLGSLLAPVPQDVHPRQPRVTDTEIALLESKGRVRIHMDCLEWVRRALETPGLSLVPLTPE